MRLLKDLAPSERPRERMIEHGPGALTQAELLAIVLGSGTRGQSAIEMAHQLLNQFGGLRPLLSADIGQLLGIHGLGMAKACQLSAVLELAKLGMEEDLKRDCLLDQPYKVKSYCKQILAPLQVEHCIALLLDNQHRLIMTHEVSRGTLTQTSIYPRELVKAGLRHHAAAVILAHNHPSGQPEPSPADLQLTSQLSQTLQLVDIRLLDHVIVAGHQAISLAERGQL